MKDYKKRLESLYENLSKQVKRLSPEDVVVRVGSKTTFVTTTFDDGIDVIDHAIQQAEKDFKKPDIFIDVLIRPFKHSDVINYLGVEGLKTGGEK